MDIVEHAVKDRKIPSLLKFKNGKPVLTKEDFIPRREELKEILQSEEYGFIPPRPKHLKAKLLKEDPNFCAGKAPLTEYELSAELEDGKEASLRFFAVIPKTDGKCPAFVLINFRPDVPDRYLPSEELADMGFAVFSFCYKDAASDDNNFKNGIAPVLVKNRRSSSSPGKIALWAWAAMRVMDFVQTLDCIDHDNVAVVGHSRLGKTALLAAAFDERFKYAISNDSGTSGAAITRNKIGENVAAITNSFPFWFAPKYKKYAAAEDKMPFDQHFLTALIPPRHLIISSAEDDSWADPESEFLTCALTNDAYKFFGLDGLIYDKENYPKAKCTLDAGDAAYHLRHGKHYLSREDWIFFASYIKKKMDEIKP